MNTTIRIGTRDSQLAIWQARQVESLLLQRGYTTELVFIKSEGDIDLQTPLYEMGVQGIFTRSLDIALLNKKIDIAVHSLKDVPTQPAKGIIHSAILPRASWKDLLVFKTDISFLNNQNSVAIIATSSVRRKAQWLNKFPLHTLENLRGNVNTRMAKLYENNWNGAIFAAAGLERIGLRPENSIELDWMLPAPAQGAITVVCREDDFFCFEACQNFTDKNTELCTKTERDFLRALLGGCSTPIGALCEIQHEEVLFKGNILSTDGLKKVEIEKRIPVSEASGLGIRAAIEILDKGGAEIAKTLVKAI
jgi:hydroxymethylbilane synthase